MPLTFESMSPEQTALVSDAIKIGFPVLGTMFGVLIGGLSTYIMSRVNRKHDVAKERSKRRLDLLLQAANDVTEFEHIIGRYAAEVSNIVHGKRSGDALKDALQLVMNNNQPLRRARMTLKLLGLADSDSHLEAYIELTREVVKYGTTISKERIREVLPIIAAGPVNFYASLSYEFHK